MYKLTKVAIFFAIMMGGLVSYGDIAGAGEHHQNRDDANYSDEQEAGRAWRHNDHNNRSRHDRRNRDHESEDVTTTVVSPTETPATTVPEGHEQPIKDTAPVNDDKHGDREKHDKHGKENCEETTTTTVPAPTTTTTTTAPPQTTTTVTPTTTAPTTTVPAPTTTTEVGLIPPAVEEAPPATEVVPITATPTAQVQELAHTGTSLELRLAIAGAIIALGIAFLVWVRLRERNKFVQDLDRHKPQAGMV